MADRLKPRVAIIGGGWAGLAAAVELVDAGWPVTLHESARQPGGRARAVPWDDVIVDNGQHLFLGAYRQCLNLMERLGTLHLLERRALDLRSPAFRLRLPSLPAPLHLALGLLLSTGLSPADKLAAARLFHALGKQRFRLAEDMTTADLLRRHRQPENLVERLWTPLCLAALNTPTAHASARVFCNVLRDSLGGARENSDLLLGRADLGRLFPEPAVRHIRERGGEVLFSSRVTGLRREGGAFRLLGPDRVADQVVVAVHPAHVPALLGELAGKDPVPGGMPPFTWEPILTLWLRFRTSPRFPYPMLALGHGCAPWAFDRNDLAPGLVAVVASASGRHLALSETAVRDEFVAALSSSLGPLPPLLACKAIAEKRATFACVPDLRRPGNATRLPGLYLAGDYTAGDYPATLEGAARSGVQCARLILESTR